MSEKSLTILFTPLDGWGHINGCIGLAEVLLNRGHRVIFAIDISFKGKLKAYGFEEEIHSLPSNDESNRKEFWAEYAKTRALALRLNPIGIAEHFCLRGFNKMLEHLQQRDSQYIEIINRVKPNCIVVDSYVCSPTLTNSGFPWIRICSAAPLLYLANDETPPAYSGLPTNGNRDEWDVFKKQWDVIMADLYKRINDWCISKGALELSPNKLHPDSTYLNIYMYPKELDYQQYQPVPKNWFRLDHSVRKTLETFEIPEQLKKNPGKLVFLSLGSFGCVDLELMTRITGMLSKSEHRFIVSKGPLHDKYELPDNMWGQRFLPQTAILPLVDLVITHGGNNTVTEAFYFGKPMLVLPLFADQFDNAQRVMEKGFGVRINPFSCSEEELIGSLDQLLSDESLKQKMIEISHRIQNSDRIIRCVEKLENILYEH